MAWGGSGSEPSAATTANSWPARPSPPTRPSRMVTVRGIRAATSGSWVTTTIVVPISALIWPRASRTVSRASWSSWLVGSSPSSRPGLVATATATAASWSWPGVSVPSGRVGPLVQTHELENLRGRGQLVASGARSRLRELDVLAGGEVGQQVARGALQHQPDLGGAELVELLLGHLRQLALADADPPGARPQQAAEEGEQRRLARAGRAEQADHLPGADGEVDTRERRDVVALGAVDVHQPRWC